MGTNIDIELSKQLLVACDQSYFTRKNRKMGTEPDYAFPEEKKKNGDGARLCIPAMNLT